MVPYTHSCAEIKADFDEYGIDVSEPGFYNHPNFIEVEREDSNYLNNYARFVQCQEYSNEYLDRAGRVIETAVTSLSQEILQDGRLGACIDTSGALEQMLVREGVWCYQLKGSLSIIFPIGSVYEPTYFHTVCSPQDLPAFAAHSWLVAPPFNVVDLTVKLQQYDAGASDLLPDYVLQKELRPVEVYTTEVCSPRSFGYYQVPQGYRNLHFEVAPQLQDFFETFPANQIVLDNRTRLKYIPTAVTAPDLPLEDNRAFSPNGKSAISVYEDVVRPALAAAGL